MLLALGDRLSKIEYLASINGTETVSKEVNRILSFLLESVEYESENYVEWIETGSVTEDSDETMKNENYENDNEDSGGNL